LKTDTQFQAESFQKDNTALGKITLKFENARALQEYYAGDEHLLAFSIIKAYQEHRGMREKTY
jgi:hypothetical protein